MEVHEGSPFEATTARYPTLVRPRLTSSASRLHLNERTHVALGGLDIGVDEEMKDFGKGWGRFQCVFSSVMHKNLFVPDNEASRKEQHLAGCSVHGCISAVVPAVPMYPFEHEVVIWDSRVLIRSERATLRRSTPYLQGRLPLQNG